MGKQECAQVYPPVWPGDLHKTAKLPDLAEIVSRPSRRQVGVLADCESALERDSPPLDGDVSSDKQGTASLWKSEIADGRGPVVKLVDCEKTEHAYAQRHARYGLFDKGRLDGIMELLRSRGEYRKLAVVGLQWRKQLDDLEDLFPNFGDVIEYLRVMYTLAEHGSGAIRLDAMLLNGPPGCGKSFFTECLADTIGSGSITLHMEKAQSNSALAGSSDYWSNSKPGEIFQALVESEHANIVVFADELEKAPIGQHDPLLAILSLLEPGTARAYVDQSVPFVTLDASHLLFVCAANDADALPDYVASRLRRFDIGLPTFAQGRKLVRHIHRRLAGELPPAAMALRLTAKTVDHLAMLPPRRMRQALREGIGRALYRGRVRVLPADLLVQEEPQVPTRGIGFV